MLDRLLKLEEHLARAEAVLLVVFVGLMLGLATYNVFYRNVLVPIQVDLLTEGEADEVSPADESTPSADVVEPSDEADDGAAGFGGGFGESESTDSDDGAAGFGGGFDEAPEESEDDAAAGFAGGFDDEPADAEPPESEPQPQDDGAAGFAGGFDDEPADTETESAEGSADDGAAGFGGDFVEDEDVAAGFGGDFGDAEEATVADESDTPVTTADVEVAEETEEPWLARFIDAIKLDWIDQVLRQLVLVVGFLGAMLAVRRRKHITIDALSKLLNEEQLHWVHLVTNAVSIFICVLLAKAGGDLVEISLEYRKEIVPWADEWMFQLIFPVGFGLLALHFVIRWIETLYYALGKAEPRPMVKGGEL